PGHYNLLLTGSKACRPVAQTLCAGSGGEDPGHSSQDRPASNVEVVEVMIVAQQHGIDFPELVRCDGGTGELVKGVVRRRVGGACGIEARIGKEPETIQLE